MSGLDVAAYPPIGATSLEIVFSLAAAFGSDLDPSIFDLEDEPYRGRALAAAPELRGTRVYRDVKPANAEGHARLAWPAVVRSFA